MQIQHSITLLMMFLGLPCMSHNGFGQEGRKKRSRSCKPLQLLMTEIGQHLKWRHAAYPTIDQVSVCARCVPGNTGIGSNPICWGNLQEVSSLPEVVRRRGARCGQPFVAQFHHFHNQVITLPLTHMEVPVS